MQCTLSILIFLTDLIKHDIWLPKWIITLWGSKIILTHGFKLRYFWTKLILCHVVQVHSWTNCPSFCLGFSPSWKTRTKTRTKTKTTNLDKSDFKGRIYLFWGLFCFIFIRIMFSFTYIAVFLLNISFFNWKWNFKYLS